MSVSSIRRTLLFIGIAVLLSCWATLASAQETRGSIGGRILDTSGAVVPGAAVTATNAATNVAVKTTTNSEGNYDLPFLISGVYTVTANAAGFKAVRRQQIELRIHDRLQLDLTLEVGAITEQVEVTAAAPILETSGANIGQVIDARRVAELPNLHGSPFSLIYLSAGVTSISAFGAYTGNTMQNPIDAVSGITVTNVNGAPPGSSDITMDGIPNTQAIIAGFGSGMANSPPADIVQEFKLEQAFDASVGHTTGTVINVSLKTGANQPHGTAYLFHQDPSWNANSFFANRAGQPKGDFTYNRWGTTLSGPVYIPKLYKGKDHTFFTYGYEGLRQQTFDTFVGTVPDPRNLGGDFSNLLALGSQYQIYDPATIRAAANGRFSIEPFSGNALPASRIDPIALKLAGHYPKPNDTGRPDGTNNFNVQSRPSPRSYYNHLARVDHVISDKQRIYVRGAIHRQLLGPYRNYWDDVATSNFQFGKDRQLAVDDVYMFSPSMVLNLRYGYSRWAGGHTPRKIGYDMTELGFSKQIADIASPQWKMFPRVSIAGMQTLGSETIIDVLNEDIHSFFASLTKQTGKHSMKFGADLRAYRDNLFYPGDASPTFTFSTNYTRGPFDNSASSPNGLGQGLASFLLGIPTSGYVDRNDSQANQSTYWSFYFHDNFRATQKLTLDMGLRWEYEGPLTERFNRSVRGFDPNATHALEPLAQAAYAAAPDPALRPEQFRVRGGLLFAGVNGAPRTQWDRSLRNFAPRFGFAYQAMKDTVLRGGFGVYFGQIGVPYQTHTIQSGFNQSTQIIPSQDNGLTFTATLSNPFPSGVLAAPKASLGADTFLGQAISFYSTAAKTPETLRWDFNIQRLLPGQLLVEIGYNGSKSIRQLNRRDQSMRNVNPVPNAFLSTSPVRDNTTNDFLTFNITNPFAGLLPGSSLNSAKIGRSQFLRPYPEFTGISATDYQSYSWYHALRLRTERRFHNGFTAQAAYTFSKTMDASEYLNGGDAAPTRVISTLDRPHHFAFSGIFELPVGKGRRVFANAGRAANALLGGWQAGSVWQLVSGEPLNFGNVLFLGNIKDIALPANQRTVDRWINTGAGFVTSVTQQLVSNLRTFPLRFSGIRADRVNGWDFSLIKSTNVGEHRQIQFRAEFLNAFNHPNAFAPPDISPTSSAFGRITSMYSTPRTIQLGGKYVF